jgi:TorA maturation chaperone TorD
MTDDRTVANGTAVSNGAGTALAVVARPPSERPVKELPETETIVAAVDLLSHFWSRPLPHEVEKWLEARDLVAETHRLISSDSADEPLRVPDGEESLALLDEFERLFVGPGQVPCPPYESFWREDVPVDIRRTLMGPCTAELKELYHELGLQVSSGAGELPDHVAIELEALAYALSRGPTEPVARRIFEEHLAVFLPRLCRGVAHNAEMSFYRDLAAVTLDWLATIKAYFAAASSG